MSWFARSLASPFMDDPQSSEEGTIDSSSPPSKGVKEDLSQLTKTFTRQLRGVASFLAPPPQTTTTSSSSEGPTQNPNPNPNPDSGSDSSNLSADTNPNPNSPRLGGIRNDLFEIGGSFKAGFSRLSSNKAVTEISRFASNLLPLGDDEDEEDVDANGGDEKAREAVGITEEVLAFARNISMHPETWLDFPLFADDEDSDDFDMSDAQQEHALAVERLAPRLAALRIELCPSHMSEGCFWKIYFVLLHSRLNKHDADLLSTPQIVEARSMLMHELQNRTKKASEGLDRSPPHVQESINLEPQDKPAATYLEPTSSGPMDSQTFEKQTEPIDTRVVDKSVIEESPVIQNKGVLSSTLKVSSDPKFEDGDDWLEEEEGNEMGGSVGIKALLGNEEDVSFSDLEEEEDTIAAPSGSRATGANALGPSSARVTRDWVQLNNSSSEEEREKVSGGGKARGGSDTGEGSDWLRVDEDDVV
ncbi:uncharacterized protein LOC18446937 [Amborella trichopoda]|uniref:uncharacterized protein LOC18446937 n=1 Tax=Amborella trichopoda TaxID=13333 RepID=UPI0005D3AC80|nr:uncharacterized protein LOC18446937 [Amborella trichopoda]|eukprot:XP_011628029.1 uncharacterized protein LOC18446937 [Amborella trichopoda]